MLDHLPNFLIMSWSYPFNLRLTAPPDRRLWEPMRHSSYPAATKLSAAAACLSASMMSFDWMRFHVVPFSVYEPSGVLSGKVCIAHTSLRLMGNLIDHLLGIEIKEKSLRSLASPGHSPLGLLLTQTGAAFRTALLVAHGWPTLGDS